MITEELKKKLKNVKNAKAAIDHFKRSTSYQKRNGQHNNHSMNYKMNKKAGEATNYGQRREEMAAVLDDEGIQNVASHALNKPNVSLEDAHKFNRLLRQDGAEQTEDRVNELYASGGGAESPGSSVTGMLTPTNLAFLGATNTVFSGVGGAAKGSWKGFTHKPGIVNRPWNALKFGLKGGASAMGRSVVPNSGIAAWKLARSKGAGIPRALVASGQGMTARLSKTIIPRAATLSRWAKVLGTAANTGKAGGKLGSRFLSWLPAIMAAMDGGLAIYEQQAGGRKVGEQIIDSQQAAAARSLLGSNTAGSTIMRSVGSGVDTLFSPTTLVGNTFNTLSGGSAERRVAANQRWEDSGNRYNEANRRYQESKAMLNKLKLAAKPNQATITKK